MKRAALLSGMLAVVLLIAAPTAVRAKVGGGDVSYAPKGAAKVVFQHEYHVNVKSMKCTNCHYKTFQMKSGDSAYKMDMATLTKGQFCGSCHDGKKGFDLKDAQSCKRCHKE